MLWLYIPIALILLLVAVFSLKVKIGIEYRNDDVFVFLKILGIAYPLYPKKKKPIDLDDYKTEKPKKPQKSEKTNEKSGASVGENIKLICEIVKAVKKTFFRYLVLEISNIKIAVGGTDAAKTAITYGITVQSVEYLLAILSEITNVKRYRKSVNISADFTAEKTVCDISIVFGIRIYQAFLVLCRAAAAYLKNKSEQSEKNKVQKK
ncbi:MAG: hypothetical protein J5922_04990 [Clostridia bacterium]|nr:hypothetical protein [Clostridia bacterium]